MMSNLTYKRRKHFSVNNMQFAKRALGNVKI